MNEKENLMIALDGGMPEWTPCFWNGAQLVLSSAAGNIPPFGSPGGKDAFGVEWIATESANGQFTPSIVSTHVLTDITKWKEQVTFPDPEAHNWEEVSAQDLAMFGIDRENYAVDYYNGNGLFERLHFLMGMQDAMEVLITEPEAAYELVGAIADMYIEYAKKIATYYQPDYYTFLDDFAFMKGLFISPDTFKQIFAPHLKRIIDFVESTPMKFKMHCCGRFELLIDEFYELGVRRIDPCQPCNDLAAVRRRYPDLAMMGGLDLQGVVDFPGVTEEQLRQEVRRCIDEYGSLGGYVMFGGSVSLYDPAAFGPEGTMTIICDEATRYAKEIAHI